MVRGKLLGSVASASLVISSLVTLSGAAEAADGPWIMPLVRDLNAEQAIEAIRDVTGPVELDIALRDTKGNREVINLANWTVCSQAPSPEGVISQKSRRVVLFVKRAADDNCWA